MTPSNVVAAKTSARRRAKETRGSLVDAAREVSANRLLLDCLERVQRDMPVSGYLSIGSEIDPIAAMTTLHESGRQLCVPVVDGPRRPLRFLHWAPDAPLITAAFGVRIPADGNELKPVALIVPLLAFDRQGYRLGYGGGYYDRTLKALRAEAPDIVAIGFAYSGQEVAAVPKEEFDQPLNLVVTDLGVVEVDYSGFS